MGLGFRGSYPQYNRKAASVRRYTVKYGLLLLRKIGSVLKRGDVRKLFRYETGK